MEMNGGFLVTKIKQLGDRIFEKILSEKILMRSMELRGAFYMCCGRRMESRSGHSRSKCGLAITSLTTMLERWKIKG